MSNAKDRSDEPRGFALFQGEEGTTIFQNTVGDIVKGLSHEELYWLGSLCLHASGYVKDGAAPKLDVYETTGRDMKTGAKLLVFMGNDSRRASE